MQEPNTEIRSSNRRLLKLSIIVIIVVCLLILAVSWVLSRGVEDDKSSSEGVNSSTTQSSKSIPNEPSNPNVSGGSNAGGTDTSNDPNITTPSPAGGVDTNNVPTGGSSNTN